MERRNTMEVKIIGEANWIIQYYVDYHTSDNFHSLFVPESENLTELEDDELEHGRLEIIPKKVSRTREYILYTILQLGGGIHS
jgi:hypothetical protein